MKEVKKISDWIEIEDEATTGAGVEKNSRYCLRKRTHSEVDTADAADINVPSTITKMFKPSTKKQSVISSHTKNVTHIKQNLDVESCAKNATTMNVSDSESEEDLVQKIRITFTAEVHAEADFDPGEPKPFDVETPESLLKPKFKRSMDATLDINGIYPIKDGVAWKVIAMDWEKYKIIDETPKSKSIELIERKMDNESEKSQSPRENVDGGKSGLKLQWSDQKKEIEIGITTRKCVDRDGIKRAKRSATEVYLDQELERQRNTLSFLSSDSDDELENDENQENQENQTTHSSIRTSDSRTDANQNVLRIANKNVPTEQSPKAKPTLEPNAIDDFEMLVSGPTYQKGQLIGDSNSSHSSLIKSNTSQSFRLSSDSSGIE